MQAQQAPEPFRWADFHSAQDHDVVNWVERSMQPEKWSSIREIGVEYDAALVLTTQRSAPQAMPGTDTFTLWSASLTTHSVAPILTGVNLRWLEWLQFAPGHPRELVALYDSCRECAADTFLTAFYYDLDRHAWAARWLRGDQAVPVWTARPPEGVNLSQIYAILADPDGTQYVATWNHLEYPNQKDKDPEDFLYRYDLDPFSYLERSQRLSPKQGEALKPKLCAAQPLFAGQARGQDSPLCQAPAVKPKPGRHPITTPPANNKGQAMPPGGKRQGL
jgi:hypothetical protein